MVFRSVLQNLRKIGLQKMKSTKPNLSRLTPDEIYQIWVYIYFLLPIFVKGFLFVIFKTPFENIPLKSSSSAFSSRIFFTHLFKFGRQCSWRHKNSLFAQKYHLQINQLLCCLLPGGRFEVQIDTKVPDKGRGFFSPRPVIFRVWIGCAPLGLSWNLMNWWLFRSIGEEWEIIKLQK